jgi:D-alanine transaminase
MTSSLVVYLNGSFVALAEARVSVMDRGFLFGDGVYEVIPVYNGRLFRLDEHLHRLAGSLAGIRLDPAFSDAFWWDILTTLVARNGGGNQSVYLQVTRGPMEQRDHTFPADPVPTVFAMSRPIDAGAPVEPVEAITLADIRWAFCHIKATTLLPNALMRQQALEAGAYEAILIRDGWVTEGAASNVFVVRNDRVSTPEKGAQLLPGITRDLVVELLTENAIPCTEEPVAEAALRDADEIWITSSTRKIVPVTRLDGKPVGSGAKGPIWERAIALYDDFVRTFGLSD